jgi:hypothetical protein
MSTFHSLGSTPRGGSGGVPSVGDFESRVSIFAPGARFWISATTVWKFVRLDGCSCLPRNAYESRCS